MTKGEAQQLVQTMEQAGMADVRVRTWPRRGGASYDVTATDTATGSAFSVQSPADWDERVADAGLDWAV